MNHTLHVQCSGPVPVIALLLFVNAGLSTNAQTNVQHEIQVHYQRAQAALSANRADDAVHEFRAILKLDPSNAEAYANLGQIAYHDRSYSEAADSFEKALKLKPQLWNAKAFLGLSEMMSGHTTEGAPVLLEAFPHITSQPLKIEAGTALVRYHMSRQSLDQIIDVVRDLQKENPNDAEVLYLAYRAYSALAAQSLGTLYKMDPDSARAHQVFAQAALTQDDFPGAIEQYKLAIAADPSLPGIHYELGRTLLTNSQDKATLDQAETEFKTELASNAGDADSEYELGEVCRLEAKLPDAKEHYVRALSINPDLGVAHVALGEVLTSLGDSSEALPHFEAGARLDSDDETAHYKLARAYSAAGRQDDARREMALFQKLRQAHDSAHSNRAPGANGTPKEQQQ